MATAKRKTKKQSKPTPTGDIIITRDYPGLVDRVGYLELAGDLKAIGSITVKLDVWLKVTGSIEAGWGIKAGWGITAGRGITAGSGIEAGEGIEAGCGIKAGWGIKAGLTIICNAELAAKFNLFAGVCTWRETTDDDRKITCGRLASGKVAYGKLVETQKPKSSAP